MKQKRAALNGELEFISLPEVVQLLGGNGSTGELRLQLDDGDTGVIYIVDGNPIDATKAGTKGLQALYSLIAAEKGAFEFTPKAVRRRDTIKKGRMEVILDALRIADETRIKDARGGRASRGGEAAAELPLIKGPAAGYHYVVEHEEFSNAQRIASEGKYGQWLWVVLEGTVDITKDTPKGSLTVLRLGEGAIVGDITGLSIGSNVRHVTAVASGKVHLGVLDYQRLSVEFALMSPDFKQFLITLDGRLRQLTDLAVEYHCGKFPPQSVSIHKTTVLKQGGAAKGLFVIRQGKASVVRASQELLIPLAFLEPGDFYGGMPFLRMGHEPDGASVTVSKDFKAEEMDSDQLAMEYRGLSPMFKAMIAHMANSIASITELAVTLYRAANLPGKRQGGSP